MYISHQKKFIFLHIPKCAGTTIKSIIMPYIDEHKYTIEGEKVTRIGGYQSHQKLTKTLREKYKDYFIFAFVRNPWAWNLSFYNFKCTREKHYPRLYPTFESFIKAKANHKNHQLCEWTHYGDNTQMIDFIGKFENLEEDIKFIANKLKIPIPETTPHYKNSKITNYKAKYTKQMIDIVTKIHHRDIKLLNYTY